MQRNIKGFSLIELMTAMAISLFGVMVMVQLYTMSEHNKRVTTSGDDSLNEGAIGIYSIQRDIRMGGFGIADTRIMGCNVLLRSGVTLVGLAPVTINSSSIPAGDANTDTLLVVYSYTNGSPQGTNITAIPAADQYTLQTSMAFSDNDWVLSAPAVRDCATTSAVLTPALTMSQVESIASNNITVKSGAGLAVATVVAPNYPSVFNFGQNPLKILAYAVRNKTLTVCDYATSNCGAAASVNDTSIWTPIGSNIVSLRAQYGRDTTAGSMDGVVDAFDQTTPSTATTVACDFARISAVRLAVVSRSAQAAAGVTQAAPTWDGSATTPINLTSDSQWQNYRYKVFQTVVPLRNINWLGVVSGC